MLLLNGLLYAQASKMDSLSKLFISNHNLETELRTFEEIAKELSSSELEVYSIKFQDILKKFDKEEDKLQFSKYYFLLGYYYFEKEEYVEAIRYLLTAHDFMENLNDNYLSFKLNFILGNCYIQLGNSTKQKENYQKAIDYHNKALNIKLLTNNNAERNIIYHRLAYSYYSLNNIEKSKSSLIEAENLSRKMGDSIGLCKAKINIGNLYLDNQNFLEAEVQIFDALDFAKKINYAIGIAYCYLNLGENYLNSKRYKEAIAYSKKANIEAKKIKFEKIIYASNENLGKIYFATGNFSESKHFYENNLEQIMLQKDIHKKADTYKQLSFIYLKLRSYEKASMYQNKYIDLNDSLYRVELKKKLELTESLRAHEKALFNYKLLDKDNKLKEEELKRIETLSIIGLVLLLLLSIFTVYVIKAKNRYRKQADYIAHQNKIILSQSEEISMQNEDLSKYKYDLEQLIEDRTKKLKKALKKAQESDRLKSSFLNNISHEIRTPMNAIIGFSQLIEYKDNDPNEKSLDIIVNGSYELLKIVDNIVELAKIESEIEHISIKSLNAQALNNFIEDAAFRAREYNANKNVDFRLNIVPFKGDIYTDPAKLCDLLAHLIENALKFTEKGYVEITNIEHENEIEFIVSDTGIGMVEDEISRIFDAFYKIETRSRLSRGTGLGLAIVKKTVEILKGRINVSSKPGKGTSFSVFIPKSYQD